MPAVQNKHLAYVANMTAICHPLEKLNINYFHFVRTYSDNSRISLSNRGDWMEFYYAQEFYKTPSINKHHQTTLKEDFILWESLTASKPIKALREVFNINHGITLIEETDDARDFYYFGSSLSCTSMATFFLNNISLLKRFIFYFKDKAALIIQNAGNDRISLPSPNIEHNLNQLEPSKAKEFIRETPIKKFILTDANKQIIISSREMDCIKLLVTGRTSSAISNVLHISARTVETHIAHINIKLGCHTKQEISHKISNSNLSFLLDE